MQIRVRLAHDAYSAEDLKAVVQQAEKMGASIDLVNPGLDDLKAIEAALEEKAKADITAPVAS